MLKLKFEFFNNTIMRNDDYIFKSNNVRYLLRYSLIK